MRSAVVLVIVLSACSSGMTHYDPKRPETRNTCTTDNGLPILDALGIVPSGIGAGYLFYDARQHSGDGYNPNPNGSILTIGAVALGLIAVGYLVSSIQGFSAASDCRDARL